MRTVLYKINLFNDKLCKQGHTIYMKRKEGEREQDRGETERGCMCVQRQEEVASVVKMTVEENRIVGIRIGLRQ